MMQYQTTRTVEADLAATMNAQATLGWDVLCVVECARQPKQTGGAEWMIIAQKDIPYDVAMKAAQKTAQKVEP